MKNDYKLKFCFQRWIAAGDERVPTVTISQILQGREIWTFNSIETRHIIFPSGNKPISVTQYPEA
jgi:hypothetical protein